LVSNKLGYKVGKLTITLTDLKTQKDFLWLNISALPYFRGLLRAVEARFYQDIQLVPPILDIGCGDGHFASVTFDFKIDVGIDPWREPILEARRWNAYRSLTQSDGGYMPFPDRYFNSAVSNSVLEHIPDIDIVLTETARVLKPGALLVFCVPNHQFLSSLSIGRWFDRIGLRGLGNRYRNFFNHIARHVHCDPPEVWTPRLEQAGFTIDRWWHYYPPESMVVSEWGHYLGIPYLLSRKLTGKWVPFTSKKPLYLVDRLVRPHYERNPVCDNGVCTFYITRRKG
jgi:SAM-dependent methyltransferase